MNLEELKDRLIDSLSNVWEKIEESSIYNLFKEKYDELDPNIQRYIQFSTAGLLALFLISLPLGWINSANENLDSFTKNKKIINDLLKLQKQKASAPKLPPITPSSQLRIQVQSILDKAALTKEQIGLVVGITDRVSEETSIVPEDVLEQGVQISLKKLNLEQIVDFALIFKKLSRTAKLTMLKINANSQDNHYYDVTYRVSEYSIDGSILESEPSKKKKK